MDSRTLAILFALTLFWVTRPAQEPSAPPQRVAAVLFDYQPLSSPSPAAIPSPSPLLSPYFVQDTEAHTMPEIDAKGAALFEVATGKMIFSKNGTSQFPIASISKLMTAVVALENLRLSDTLTVRESDLLLDTRHPSLAAGDTFSLDEALYFVLVPSDNAVAQALARRVAENLAAPQEDASFVAKMNERAKALGMTSTHFSTPTGLNGNLSAPRDLFLLGSYVLENHPKLFEISRQSSIALVSRQGKTYELQNTNILLGRIPGIIGGKTGYTPEADGGLLLAFEIGTTKLLSVVLGSVDRFGDTQKLFEWYRKNNF